MNRTRKYMKEGTEVNRASIGRLSHLKVQNKVRVHLAVQEQSILDWTPRPYMESDFNVLYMNEKII